MNRAHGQSVSAICGLLALLVALFPMSATAASLPSQVTVTVTDVSTNATIALADVSLFGAAPLSGLTGQDGSVSFSSVPPGTYSGSVSAPGYDRTQVSNVRVDSGSEIKISVALSKLPKTMGIVTVKASPSLDVVTQDSAKTLSKGSILQGLSLDPAANLASGMSGGETLGIEGHTAAQTSINADGVPLAPIGVATNLRAVATDIFDSADVQPSGSFSSGGAADFHVPDPTISYSYYGEGKYGTFDNGAATIFARGTVGYLGFSAGHSNQTNVDQLNGQSYLDQSGLVYPHDASSNTTSDVLKLRVPVSSTDFISALALSSQYSSSDYCVVYAGALPCGLGPGNRSSQSLSSWQLNNNLLAGLANISLVAFGTSLGAADDESHRILNQLPAPVTASFSAKTTGASLNVTAFSGSRHSIAASALVYGSRSSGISQIGLVSANSPSESSTFQRFGLTDTYRISDKVRALAGLGYNAVLHQSTSTYGNLAFAWTPDPSKKINASFSSGDINPAPVSDQGFTDPNLLRFDCTTGTAYGTAPATASESPAASESSDARISFVQRAAAVELSTTVYEQVLHGTQLDGYLIGSILDPATYPSGYLAAVSSYYSSPGGCGQSRQLTYADLALRIQQPGTAIYEGGSVAARLALGRSIVVEPYYATTVAKSTQTILGSSISPQEQLLGVPLNRIGFTIDSKPTSSFEAAGSFEHVSGNNGDFLPAYSLVNLGLVFDLRAGQLIASATNVFNQFGESLGSPSLGDSIPRIGVTSLRLIGVPLAPRAIHLSYRLRVGAPPPIQSGGPSQDIGLPDSSTFTLSPFPATPPADAFRINTDNPQCGPEMATMIRPVLSAMQSYINRDRFEPMHVLPNGVRLDYRPVSGNASFLISGNRPAVEAAIFSCTVVHGGTARDADAHRVYSPTADDAGKYDLLFSTAVGFYISYDLARIVTRKSLLLTYDGSAPENPFALNAAAPSCGSDLKELNNYFSSLGNTSSPSLLQGIVITEHRGPRPWFALTFTDLNARYALTSCGKVYELSTVQANGLGIGGTGSGNVDFASSVGFYELQPAR
jgi:hypothetical protein